MKRPLRRLSIAFISSIALLILTGAGPQAATPSRTPDRDEQVCKFRKATGTRFAKKTCRSRAKWEEMSEAARRQAAEEFTKPTISIEKGN